MYKTSREPAYQCVPPVQNPFYMQIPSRPWVPVYVEMAIYLHKWMVGEWTLIPICTLSCQPAKWYKQYYYSQTDWTHMISHGLHRQYYNTFIANGKHHSSQISSDTTLCHHKLNIISISIFSINLIIFFKIFILD